MSVSTTPAPARTDAIRVPADPGCRSTAPTRMVKRAGLAVAVGTTAWAAGILAFGLAPQPGWTGTVYDVSSLLFQVGLVALVSVQLRTGATGTGRLARFFLHAEHVLLGLAITSTLTWMFFRQYEDEAWFLALDAFWPLSMVGMFAIGIRIAIAGRWSGAGRPGPQLHRHQGDESELEQQRRDVVDDALPAGLRGEPEGQDAGRPGGGADGDREAGALHHPGGGGRQASVLRRYPDRVGAGGGGGGADGHTADGHAVLLVRRGALCTAWQNRGGDASRAPRARRH